LKPAAAALHAAFERAEMPMSFRHGGTEYIMSKVTRKKKDGTEISDVLVRPLRERQNIVDL
jgi:hypothetical protein